MSRSLNNTTISTSMTRASFLGLPRELRDMIYVMIAEDTKVAVLVEDNVIQMAPVSHALALASKQISAEFIPRQRKRMDDATHFHVTTANFSDPSPLLSSWLLNLLGKPGTIFVHASMKITNSALAAQNLDRFVTIMAIMWDHGSQSRFCGDLPTIEFGCDITLPSQLDIDRDVKPLADEFYRQANRRSLRIQSFGTREAFDHMWKVFKKAASLPDHEHANPP